MQGSGSGAIRKGTAMEGSPVTPHPSFVPGMSILLLENRFAIRETGTVCLERLHLYTLKKKKKNFLLCSFACLIVLFFVFVHSHASLFTRSLTTGQRHRTNLPMLLVKWDRVPEKHSLAYVDRGPGLNRGWIRPGDMDRSKVTLLQYWHSGLTGLTPRCNFLILSCILRNQAASSSSGTSLCQAAGLPCSAWEGLALADSVRHGLLRAAIFLFYFISAYLIFAVGTSWTKRNFENVTGYSVCRLIDVRKKAMPTRSSFK